MVTGLCEHKEEKAELWIERQEESNAEMVKLHFHLRMISHYEENKLKFGY